MKSTKLSTNQTNYFLVLSALVVGDFTYRSGLYITRLSDGLFSVSETYRASSRPLSLKQTIFAIVGQ